jgi:hypothetical protein
MSEKRAFLGLSQAPLFSVRVQEEVLTGGGVCRDLKLGNPPYGAARDSRRSVEKEIPFLYVIDARNADHLDQGSQTNF